MGNRSRYSTNWWLRIGVPGLVIIGGGYLLRSAAGVDDYASKDIRVWIIVVCAVLVVIGLVKELNR